MIPDLAFHDAKATVSSTATAFGDALSAALPNINTVSALNKESNFSSKRASENINGLSLHCFAHENLFIEREDPTGFDLLIPVVGRMTMQVGTRHFLAEANKTAFLSYPEKRIQRALVSSAVCITLNRQKLNSVYSAMRGLDGVDALDPGTRLPALHVAGISFVSLFENMFRVINAADGNGQLLKQLAIDDSLYRLCVGLLDPAVIAGDLETHAANSYVRREVLQLCEFMQAHLTQPISLSKMEQMSGLSARVLQYSFQKSFGLRPKAWLRKQRLHAARAVLNDRSRKTKITSLAHDFCFHSPSEFTQHYLVEFGELPSETMRKNMR